MLAGSGWALVLRADGAKKTFSYHNAIWNDTTTLNEATYTTGVTDFATEFKSPLFSVLGYSSLRLGMRTSDTTNWLEVSHRYFPSMQAAMSNGTVLFTGSTRLDWLRLAKGSGLQLNCNRMGYNVASLACEPCFIVRIGILGNEQANCNDSDSYIGFGGQCTYVSRPCSFVIISSQGPSIPIHGAPSATRSPYPTLGPTTARMAQLLTLREMCRRSATSLFADHACCVWLFIWHQAHVGHQR